MQHINQQRVSVSAVRHRAGLSPHPAAPPQALSMTQSSLCVCEECVFGKQGVMGDRFKSVQVICVSFVDRTAGPTPARYVTHRGGAVRPSVKCSFIGSEPEAMFTQEDLTRAPVSHTHTICDSAHHMCDSAHHTQPTSCCSPSSALRFELQGVTRLPKSELHHSELQT